MRPPLSPESWALIRAAYCDTRETVTAICQRFGIREDAFYTRRRIEDWPKRSARPDYVNPLNARARVAKAEARKVEPPSDPNSGAPSPAPSSPQRKPAKPKPTRKALALRLYEALVLKLTQLEELMASPEEKDTIAQARQTRAIAQLIKAFERVTEYDPDLLKSAGSATAAAIAATVAASAAVNAASKPGRRGASSKAVDAASPVQQRKEIADRLERVLVKRKPAGGSGGA